MGAPAVKNRGALFLAVLAFSLTLIVTLSTAIMVSAEEPPVFEPAQAKDAAELSGADLSGLEKALGLVGLPGALGVPEEGSTYNKAWRVSDGPAGATRLTYGERYLRNPDGSYGRESSSRLNGGNLGERLLERALSAGSGYFSSWAAGWLGGYGQARVSFRVNDGGDVTGSGDFLYPIYDSERTAFFTQLGLRTMANNRVIGNFGLGQRFFLSENLALGYNAFIDRDFSRGHTRGGAGVETWYNWLRLSANYYAPLSGWKGSKDYDHRLVEERPARGYDARLTGYLPFYRNLAVTGAMEKWKGDHVGSFGSDEVAQKDPKVWSYGLEWTPVPVLSLSTDQRHSGGQKETRFGLTFNYRFGLGWEEQLTPAAVAEMRTVDGSRHDFINRQNEMILQYRDKEPAYRLTADPISLIVNKAASVTFTLTKNGKPMKNGTVVQFTSDTVNFDNLIDLPITLSNGDGTFVMPALKGLAPGSHTVYATVEGRAVSCLFMVSRVPLKALEIIAQPMNTSSAGPASMTVKAVDEDGNPAPDVKISWKIVTDTSPYLGGLTGTAVPYDFGGSLNTTTGANGEVTANNLANNAPLSASDQGPVSGLDREARVIAYVSDNPAIEIASNVFVFGTNPFEAEGSDGSYGHFITIGLQSPSLQWPAADAFCRAQGGKLPAYAGQSSDVDGFGNIGDLAPLPGWPIFGSWTREWHSPGYHWMVLIFSNTYVGHALPYNDLSYPSAVCVR